jgi:hypothetical protein
MLIELLMLSLIENIIKFMSYCYFWANIYFNFNDHEKTKISHSNCAWMDMKFFEKIAITIFNL